MRLWRTLGTEWLLDQWGIWARIPEETRLTYPSKANFVKFEGGSIKLPEIDLDTALVVDRIVKFSGLIEPNYETVLVSRYVKRKTQIQMARRLHTSRREAVEILHKGEAWVDGYLHSVAADLMRVEQLPDNFGESAA